MSLFDRFRKPEPKRDELTLTDVVLDANGQPITQARLFASAYARNAAHGMLDIVTNVQTRSGKIARLALGASIPHQIGYCIALSIPFMHWNTIPQWLENFTMIAVSIVAPVIADLMILSCIETIGGKAVDQRDKRKAMWVMIVPTLASGYVNFLAPAPLLLKCLAAFIVAMVPLAVSLRFVRPDFVAMENMETGVTKALDKAAEAEAKADADAAAAAATQAVKTSRPSRDEQKRRKAKAEKLAKDNPNMTVAMLMRETGVSRPTAAKVLAAVIAGTASSDPVAAVQRADNPAPVSPAHAVKR